MAIQVKGVKYLNLDSESSVRWSGFDAGLVYFLGGYMLVIYLILLIYIYICMYIYILHE